MAYDPDAAARARAKTAREAIERRERDEAQAAASDTGKVLTTIQELLPAALERVSAPGGEEPILITIGKKGLFSKRHSRAGWRVTRWSVPRYEDSEIWSEVYLLSTGRFVKVTDPVFYPSTPNELFAYKSFGAGDLPSVVPEGALVEVVHRLRHLARP